MKRFAILPAVIAAAAIAHAQEPRPQTAGHPTRVIANGEWQVVRTIGRETDAFDNPIHLVATEGRFIVSDAGTNSIKSFRMTGEREWSFGRTGSGPGEFRHIFDLSLDDSGDVLVYDEALSRLTVIDRSGRLVRTIATKGRADRAVFGATAGTYVLLTTTSDTLARTIDSSGTVRSIVPLPADMRSFPGLARELSRVISSPSGHLLPFRWTSRMLVLDAGGSVRRGCTGLDSLSFPDVFETKLSDIGELKGVRASRIDPRAREATIYATSLEGKLAIEPLANRGKPRVIDIYASDCGRYLESRPFPFASGTIAGTRNLLVAMLAEPVPHVVVLRWNPRQP
jgi:hypothetical protein